MSDEDIDLSDTPPVTDEMWERGVWRKGENSKNNCYLISVDDEVVEFFKEKEGDYRENINRFLREYVETQHKL